MHPHLPMPATMLPAPEGHSTARRAGSAGSTAALGRPALLGQVIQGLSTDLPVQPQLLTPRGGVLAALGGGKSGLAPPTPLLATRQCPSAFCPLEFPDASAAGRATPELLLSHCTAISFPRQGCLPAFGRRGHQGPERGVSLPGVTQGNQTRACSLPLGLGRLVCAQAEDAQRKSGTHKDIHLRC